jgi:antitoxin CcdA
MNNANQLRKRPVNLTLSENLVIEARTMTGNLSAVVESLLIEYVEKERESRRAMRKEGEEATKVWNAFAERSGSFADEYVNL